LHPISLVAISCFDWLSKNHDGRSPEPGEGNATARFHQSDWGRGGSVADCR